MFFILLSFFAGILTILAPCVLPILPVILAGSIGENTKKGPYIIIASLTISLVLFSILLKITTVFIWVSPSFWAKVSGIIIIILGIITIFPNLWKNLSSKFDLSNKSNTILQKSAQKEGTLKNILIGLSLGPVFSSCSPTYALILAIILQENFFIGLLNLAIYALGLASVLLLIAFFGQRIVKKLKIVADPKSKFQKILGVIFLIVGIAIFSGYDKKIEAKILNSGYFIDTISFEQKILENTKK